MPLTSWSANAAKDRPSLEPTGGGSIGTQPDGSCAPVTRTAGIAKRVGPHTLRHAFITAALDTGVPLRDVQDAASHADPRTTIRYDRARISLDRHATYIVATFLAGASR
jgi:integrase